MGSWFYPYYYVFFTVIDFAASSTPATATNVEAWSVRLSVCRTFISPENTVTRTSWTEPSISTDQWLNWGDPIPEDLRYPTSDFRPTSFYAKIYWILCLLKCTI